MGVLLFPLQNAAAKITSAFGIRTAPNAAASTNHKGIDIAAVVGSDVLAANSGTVTAAGYNNLSGNYIRVRGADGTETFYGHLSERLRTVGDVVAAGEVIAKSGNTGNSTGPHLHFGVYKNGVAVDPLPLFSAVDEKIEDLNAVNLGDNAETPKKSFLILALFGLMSFVISRNITN